MNAGFVLFEYLKGFRTEYSLDQLDGVVVFHRLVHVVWTDFFKEIPIIQVFGVLLNLFRFFLCGGFGRFWLDFSGFLLVWFLVDQSDVA